MSGTMYATHRSRFGHARLRSLVVVAALACAGAAGAFVLSTSAEAQPAGGQPQQPASTGMQRFRAAIPAGLYRSLIVSPAAGGAAGDAQPGSVVRFIIRTRDATSVVEDFVFHVPAGQTTVIGFESPLQLHADALLYGSANVPFAAWGQTDRGLVRVEDVERDPLEDRDARERERDYEAFLRERERNRVR